MGVICHQTERRIPANAFQRMHIRICRTLFELGFIGAVQYLGILLQIPTDCSPKKSVGCEAELISPMPELRSYAHLSNLLSLKSQCLV